MRLMGCVLESARASVARQMSLPGFRTVVRHLGSLVDFVCGHRRAYCFPIPASGDYGALYNKEAKFERTDCSNLLDPCMHART